MIPRSMQVFGLSMLSFLVMDFLWLGFVVKNFNLRQLADIGRIENGDFQLNYGAAVAAYFLMGLSVPAMLDPRVTQANSLPEVFGWGALCGLIIYGIFDFTNWAILKGYPPAFVAADIAWGTFLYGCVAVLVKKILPL
jgi:uncharacterized membrane protein